MQVYAIAGDVILRPLGTEVAVHLSDRCQTHLLDDAGGQVLEAFQNLASEAVGVDIDRLAAHLLGESQPPALDALQRHQDARDALRPVLAALVHIGVLTVSPC